MKVQEIFTAIPQTCSKETNLSTAGWLMWENDCGVLPVLDQQQKVIGMITDRDICVATATKPRPACEITVGEVITGNTFSCKPNDDVRDALKTMRQQKIRRLPVVDADGRLKGILSINDLILNSQEGSTGRETGLTYDDIVTTLKTLCAHRKEVAEHRPRSRQAVPAGV